jgi:hypothetical protein
METYIWVILVVIAILVIYYYRQPVETFLTSTGWAPTGADLVEICGRNPMYGGGRCPWWGTSGSADAIEIRGRTAMYK